MMSWKINGFLALVLGFLLGGCPGCDQHMPPWQGPDAGHDPGSRDASTSSDGAPWTPDASPRPDAMPSDDGGVDDGSDGDGSIDAGSEDAAGGDADMDGPVDHSDAAGAPPGPCHDVQPGNRDGAPPHCPDAG
ncbi:MAG: hypothetical protein HY698_10380 [Deltaproteobacteria bacterium]|nr:hypothetical protein [Deltaproteobacteria bacterium]